MNLIIDRPMLVKLVSKHNRLYSVSTKDTVKYCHHD